MATNNNTDYVSLRRLLAYHKEVVQPAIEDAGGGFKKPEITEANGKKYVIVSELTPNTEYIIPAGVYIFHDQTAFDNSTTHDWNGDGSNGTLSYAKILRTFNNVSGYSLLAIGGEAQLGGRVAFKAWRVEGTPTIGFTSYTVTDDEYDKITKAILGVRIDNNTIAGTNNYANLPNVESLTTSGPIKHGLLSKSDYDAFNAVKGAVTSAKFATDVLQPTVSNHTLSIPVIGSNTQATLGAVYYSDWHRFNNAANNAITAVKFGNTPVTITDKTLTIPIASANTSAGLLSNTDYAKFNAVANVLDDTTEDNVINRINEVFDFLNEYNESVDLATMLNNRAILNEVTEGVNNTEYSSNTFNVENVFNKLTTFNNKVHFDKPVVSDEGLYFGYRLNGVEIVKDTDKRAFVDSHGVTTYNTDSDGGYIYTTSHEYFGVMCGRQNIGDITTYVDTQLLYPFRYDVDDVVVDELYLTSVLHYDDNNTLTGTEHLCECEPITAASFATWLGSVA